MATNTSLIVGTVAGLVVAVVTVIGLQHLRPSASTNSPTNSSNASTDASTPFDAPPKEVPSAVPTSGGRAADAVPAPPSRSVPVTPVYGPLPTDASVAGAQVASVAPDDPRTIYRCRTGNSTVYSNDPCPNATVVDDSNAASGYDTRPSDKLARLVAEGRADESAADAAPAPAQAVRRRRSAAPQSAECAILRRQIRDLDASASVPQYPHVLDEIRATRQDVQTSIARNRC